MNIKSIVKKLIPSSLRSTVEQSYRLIRGIVFYYAMGRPGHGVKLIGITGTNGKTTTVTILNSILKESGAKTVLRTTVNTEILGKYKKNESHLTSGTTADMMGFIKRTAKLKPDYIILEVTSQALHQHRLWGLKFEAVAITNLTYEHMEYHKDMDHYAAAKAMLFKGNPSVSAVNGDDEWADYFSKFKAGKKLVYGQGKNANFKIVELDAGLKGNSFKIEARDIKLNLKSSLVGEFNAYNTTTAAAVAHGLGIADKAIERGVAKLKWVDGRMNVVDEGQKFAVFTDYAHTPDGLTQVMKTLKPMTKGKLILVQSAMDGRDTEKRPKMGEVAARFADSIYVTDEEAFDLPREVMRQDIIRGILAIDKKANYHEIEDRQTAIDTAIAEAGDTDTVLIIPFGHQTHMTFYDKTIHWDDREAASKAIKKLSKKGK